MEEKYEKEIINNMKEEITFIEIKEGTEVNINRNKVLIDENTPFPVLVDEIIEEIKKDEFYGFKNTNIIEGILLILGIDSEFKLKKKYIDILEKSKLNIKAYLISLINDEKIDIDKKIVYANALFNIGEVDEKTYFIYGNVLEMKGTQLFNKEEKEKSEYFMDKAVEYYNKALDENIKFSLSYYKLGYFYKQNNQYLNAKAYWNKFLEYDENDIRKQEIREQLEEIESYIKFEEGYKNVLKGNVEKGLEILIPLLDVFKNWWKLFFVIGVAFRQKQEFHIAKKYFKNVIDINPAQIDAINELAVCEMSTGDYKEAKEVLDQGIKINPQSHELYCNRAAANIYLDEIEKAQEDVEKSLKINPDNDVAKVLQEEIEKIKNKG